MPVAPTGEISKAPTRMERFSSRGTAFLPTDVPMLSRWAKVLMMVQATISLASVALLAGVNILRRHPWCGGD